MFHPLRSLTVVLPVCAAFAILGGCGGKTPEQKVEYLMGERVQVGSLTYNVIETAWRSQLGTEYKVRIPQQRFLLITISATNGGGKDVSVPMLSLENSSGELIRELENGDGVEPWFGLFRTIAPAQTQQGKIVFDVPFSSYRLRLSDGADAIAEKTAWVKIDLNLNPDLNVDTPTPGDVGVPATGPLTPPIK
jgi:hypothetical protein